MADCQYRNFDVTIRGEDLPYHVAAVYRGLSATSSLRVDARVPLWQGYLETLGDPHIRQGEERLAEIGGRLYEELFQDELAELWSQARSDLDDGGRLRIRLALHPPAVAALPWELLHDPRRNQPVAVEGRIAMVRKLNAVGYVARPRPLQGGAPIKVLLAAVETVDGLALEQEINHIRSVLDGLPPGRMRLDVLAGPITVHQLQERLLQTQPDILHVMSHGDQRGLLLWADGGPGFVSAASLQAVFQQADSLKLVFLNACLAGQVDAAQPFATLAHRILQSGLPAVIAMAFEILDASAVAFAGSVYRALVSGPCPGHIDAAVSFARNALYVQDPDRVDYATPILWLNAEDGRLFPLESESDSVDAREGAVDSQSQRYTPPRPEIDFGLEEKEAWLQTLPEELPVPEFQQEYRFRRRNLQLLLQQLRRDAAAQAQGATIDVRRAQQRLQEFEHQRNVIQRLLNLPGGSA